jgi:diguanylate cyclase (GGDEF)-like protein/PAS domain S-box-containing protein
MTPIEAVSSLETLETIIDVVASPIFVKDREHRWLFMNDAMCRFIGRRKEELIGRSDFDVVAPEQAEVFWKIDDQVFATGEDNENEEELTDANGIVRTIVTRKRLVHTPDGTPLLVAVITDITAFRKAEAHSRYLAFHDPLSGLPNRSLLNDRTEQALKRLHREPNASCALLYIDLDRFKEVNDTYGHQAGDELICEFAGRLSELVRGTDTAARLGGDEFAVLIPEAKSRDGIEALCRRIIAAARREFHVSDTRACVGASIGVAIADDGATTLNDLLRKADVALYAAKRDRGNCCRFFTEDMDEGRNRRRMIEKDLRLALEDGQGLEVHYLPLVSSSSEAVVGMEALVRWKHPQLGLLSPMQFLPIAEEAGIISELGDWVLTQACRALAAWPRIAIAVNVSPAQLHEPGFADRFFSILRAHRVEPQRVEIEIAESAFVNVEPVARRTLRNLRKGGVRVALDGFGTGYSSLTHLRGLNVDKIKIDRSFTRNLGQSADSDIIIGAVTEIGRALGLAVTVEGVETEDQRARLLASGCTELQGHLFSHPLPESEMAAFLRSSAQPAPSQVA